MEDLELIPTFLSTKPGAPALTDGEVHIWAVPLNGDATAFRADLSSAELDRLHRFRFAAHQRRFQISHAATRRILAGYLGCSPQEVALRHGPRGKPYIDGEGPRFNLSHSGDLALVAVASNELGVDVEKVRRLESLRQIAQRHFSDVEYAALEALDVAEQELAFYRCWTRKEAYIKALGEGLSMALDSFDVSIGEAAAFLACHDSREDPSNWSMLDISPSGEFVAAVAVRQAAVVLQRFLFEA